MIVFARKCLYDGKEIEHVTVNTPDISPSTATVMLPGGETEIPIPLYGSIEISLSFPGLNKDSAIMMAPGKHSLEYRYAGSTFQGADLKPSAIKVFAEVLFKSQSGSETTIAENQETDMTFEALRFRAVADGEEIILIDKVTGQVVIAGTDYSKQWRSMLG